MASPSASEGPPNTDDPPSFSGHIAFDSSRLVGSPEQLRKLAAEEIQKRLQLIEQTIDVITKFRTFHNSLAPVNALPAEILGVIFAHLVSRGDLFPKPPWTGDTWVARQGDSPVDPPTGNRDIVAAAAVCRYWHTVITLNPWLWVSFPIHDPEGVQEFLARSKDLPVSLSLTQRFPSSFGPTLKPSIHRIRSLYISTDLANDIELLWAEFSTPAPNLQEFFIEHLPHGFWTHGHIVGRGIRLPPMFKGQAPSLRVLTLRGSPSPFKVLPASLVHLDIGTMQGPLPRFTELLQMLSGCALLEILNLRGAWKWDEFENHNLVRNGLALPNLDAMYLELEPDDAPGFLLSSLTLPTYTNVSISCILEGGGSFGYILNVVDPTLGPSCFRNFSRLHIFREGEDWRLQAYRDADTFPGPPALDVDCIDHWGINDVDWHGFLLEWPFDASGIETLVLCHTQGKHYPFDGGDPVDLNRTFDQWDLMFGQLPALKTLRVMGLPTNELESLLDVLSDGLPDPINMLCPDLSTLEIFDVPVSDKVMGGLLSVAGLRKLDGMQTSVLERMELFNCNLTDFGLLPRLGLSVLGVEVVVDEEIIVRSGLEMDAGDQHMDMMDIS